MVIEGDTLYASYYTSDIRYDWPWIIGMLSKSDIQFARVDLKSLKAIAQSK